MQTVDIIEDRSWSRVATLGFFAYALLAAPWLGRSLKAGLAGGERLWLPGAVVMVVLLLEPVGLRWKLQFLRRHNRGSGFIPSGGMLGIFSAAGIGHVIVTMFLGMLALDGWGAVGAGAEGASAWWGAIIVGLVLKEFVGLLAAGGQSLSPQAPGHWKEGLADLFLAAYGAVAYTAWWGVIVNLEDAGSGSLGARLALLPVFLAIFLFFYLPMRLPFLLEEYHLRSAAGRRVRIGVELVIGAVLGLYPFLWS